MMKFYGTMICKECLEAREWLPAAGIQFEYADITVDIANMKEFLHLRDTRKEFDAVKKQGGIGIPCFVKDDGSIVIGVKNLLEETKG